MSTSTEAPEAGNAADKKPRLALAIATALGVGYAPKAPGTFGSLVGVATIYLFGSFLSAADFAEWLQSRESAAGCKFRGPAFSSAG